LASFLSLTVKAHVHSVTHGQLRKRFQQVWSRSRAAHFRAAQFRAAQFHAARFSAASGGGGAETCSAELSSATDEKDMFILFINSLTRKC